MSCGSEYEDRNQKEGNAGLMEAWSHAQYARETERERERENTENSITKSSNSMSVQVCVFNTHVLYKFLQGLTEVLSYFNAH